MNIKLLALDKLIPYARNPRNNINAVDKVAASIKEFGFQQPIVIDTDNVIIAGHTRYLAAQKIDLKKVPVQVASDLTKAQIKAYRLADNRVAQESTWDDELLAIELSDLDEQGFDLDLTGFDASEIESLMEGLEINNGLVDEDDAPDLEEEPVSLKDDLWILGNHKLYCGDSTRAETYSNLLKDMTVDLMFTDPPYGMSYGGGRSKSDGTVKVFGVIEGDDLRGDKLIKLIQDSVGCANSYLKQGAASYICFTWRCFNEFNIALENAGVNIKSCIVWDKKCIGLGFNNYRPQHEFIFYGKGEWYGAKNESDVWHMSREPVSNYVHPTQKPVELVAKALLNSSKKGDIILDPFCGSGSTLIACEKHFRIARVIEIDPRYVDVTIRRWQDFTGEHALLNGLTYSQVTEQRQRQGNGQSNANLSG